jgi:hypothetical protein
MKRWMLVLLLLVNSAAQAKPVHLACKGTFGTPQRNVDGTQSIIIDTEVGNVRIGAQDIPITIEDGDDIVFEGPFGTRGLINGVTGEVGFLDKVRPLLSFIGTCKPTQRLF